MVTAVTGASGHLGGNLVRLLLEEGRTVRVLARSDRRALDGLPVTVVEGDLSDPAALRALVDGVDTVFHLAGRISIAGPEHGLVARTNVEGVQHVLDACRERGVRRLVHCSSIHAFDTNPADQVIDETRALALGADYAPYDRSKAQGQSLVMEAARQGLDAVVVNPTAIVGPHDFKPSRMGSVFLDIYHHRLPTLIDGGYNWVDARDVARGALLAEQKGRRGESYLLSGTWIHICDVSRLISRITGRKTNTVAAPVWVAAAASIFSLAWGRLRGVTPKFTPAAIEALQSHRLISHDKATRELGYAPRPFEETVRDTMDWFRAAGML
ncbi:MAG TPA: NAD-dependent epimerase/dehydratase family protein [bacterium]|nr:NAD-dependent epimerase/dehydratase family protein [bacterium]